MNTIVLIFSLIFFSVAFISTGNLAFLIPIFILAWLLMPEKRYP